MTYSIPRSLYRFLLKLYPPIFRQRFGSELLNTCDELESERYSRAKLLLDVSRSVVKQWAGYIRSIERSVPEPSLPVYSLLKGHYPTIPAGTPPAKRLLQSSFIVAILTLAVVGLEKGPRFVAPPTEIITKIDLREYSPRTLGRQSPAEAHVQAPVF
jgi:hypothetical protein